MTLTRHVFPTLDLACRHRVARKPPASPHRPGAPLDPRTALGPPRAPFPPPPLPNPVLRLFALAGSEPGMGAIPEARSPPVRAIGPLWWALPPPGWPRAPFRSRLEVQVPDRPQFLKGAEARRHHGRPSPAPSPLMDARNQPVHPRQAEVPGLALQPLPMADSGTGGAAARYPRVRAAGRPCSAPVGTQGSAPASGFRSRLRPRVAGLAPGGSPGAATWTGRRHVDQEQRARRPEVLPRRGPAAAAPRTPPVARAAAARPSSRRVGAQAPPPLDLAPRAPATGRS
jgi:hypothetical protein